MDEAAARLRSIEPLKAEEARALFPWISPLNQFLPRIQMDLAIQQIEAVERFDKASTKFGKRSLVLAGTQALASLLAIVISVIALLRSH
jgi:hypothetical protein